LETSLQRLKGKVNAEKMLWATNCYIGQRHGCSTTFHPTVTKKHLSEKKSSTHRHISVNIVATENSKPKSEHADYLCWRRCPRGVWGDGRW
jgi:hypothetical protein